MDSECDGTDFRLGRHGRQVSWVSLHSVNQPNNFQRGSRWRRRKVSTACCLIVLVSSPNLPSTWLLVVVVVGQTTLRPDARIPFARSHQRIFSPILPRGMILLVIRLIPDKCTRMWSFTLSFLVFIRQLPRLWPSLPWQVLFNAAFVWVLRGGHYQGAGSKIIRSLLRPKSIKY